VYIWRGWRPPGIGPTNVQFVHESLHLMGTGAAVLIMEHATSIVTRSRRATRRQAILACAYSAYLALFAASIAGLVSLFAATGAIAVTLLIVSVTVMLVGGGLWALDTRAARRTPLAAVIPLRPAPPVAISSQQRAAR
jgi:hypothetical protein